MSNTRGYKYRIYPNASQRSLLERIFGCCRYVRNHFLALRRDEWKANHRDAFGFTKEDVELLARHLGHEDKLPELTKWYDGYNFQGIEIYNPWSVLNYFNQGCKPCAYWENAASNDILRNLLASTDRRRRKEIARLMKGGSVVTTITEDITYQDIGVKRKAFWSFMLHAGYLNCTKTQEEEEAQYILPISNHEIHSLLQDLNDGIGRTEAVLCDKL